VHIDGQSVPMSPGLHEPADQGDEHRDNNVHMILLTIAPKTALLMRLGVGYTRTLRDSPSIIPRGLTPIG